MFLVSLARCPFLYTCISQILPIYMCIAIVGINRTQFPSRSPKGKKDSEVTILVGSVRVYFLLFAHAHDPAHPQFEIADVLWDFAQLHLHLDLFLCSTV